MIKSTIIRDNETILDISIRTIGTLDYVYELAKLNNITSIDTILTASERFYYDDRYNVQKQGEVFLNPIKRSDTVIIQVLENQSIFDIALQYYGGLEFITEILTDNNIDLLNPYIELSDIKLRTNRLVDYYRGIDVSYMFSTLSKVEQDIDDTGNFILLENGDYLLLENGYKIELEN